MVSNTTICVYLNYGGHAFCMYIELLMKELGADPSLVQIRFADDASPNP